MNKYLRVLLLGLVDAILVTGSVYAAYLLRFDFIIQKEFIPSLPYVFLVYVVAALVSFAVFRIYRRIWQYASIGDLLSIFKGTILLSLLVIVTHYLVMHPLHGYIIPRSIYLIAAPLIFLAVGGSRFIWRMYRDSYIKIQPYHKRALIIGAGDAGTMVVKELKQSHSEFYPVAFIDDNVQKTGMEVMGVPVAGRRQDIPAVVEDYRVEQIIIALPSASRQEIAAILDICKRTKTQIKMIPRMNDLINGKVALSTIRDVSVEDLLGRDPVEVDLREMAGYLENQVVLVTGAGGSIGSELCRQVAKFSPKQLVLLGRGENSIYEIQLELLKSMPELKIEAIIADIQHRARLEEVFDTYRPDVVFHAAAHKHVPLMEHNPIEAVKNNILGTRNVAECADKYKAKRFVMISTDKAVNPTSVMGTSKKIAEMIVQSLNRSSQTVFSAVRFGNVLGSRGSVIPIFKKQIEAGGPVTVTHPEMIRYFMTIPEAVQLVIQTGALAQGGEVFILDMGKPVKIADLAYDLIRLSGMEPGKEIEIEYTGMRPGEKLFEELLTSEEGTQATKHERIFVGKADEDSQQIMDSYIQRFECLVQQGALKEEVRKFMKVVVPSYQLESDSTNETAVKEALKASLEIVAGLESK